MDSVHLGVAGRHKRSTSFSLFIRCSRMEDRKQEKEILTNAGLPGYNNGRCTWGWPAGFRIAPYIVVVGIAIVVETDVVLVYPKL